MEKKKVYTSDVNMIREELTCETPALVPAAFACPQFPVAREYLSPLVIVLALIANCKLTSFPLSTHWLRDTFRLITYAEASYVQIDITPEENQDRNLLNIGSHIPC